MTVRAWSWTRLDGRNVVALPTQTEIHLYDSDDFVLLSRLAPSGHRSPVAFVRWSGFHGKLASLSADQILVHAPQRDPQQRSCVQLVSICSYRLDGAHASIRGLSFSRTADELLVCGRDTGLYKLDVRTPDHWTDEAPVVWRKDKEDCDVAKYSPSAFVFATLRRKEREVKVWRMRRRLGDADKSQRLDRVETLKHEEPVVCFAWRPTTMQGRSALESDGTRKAQWFEPPRILLTCTRSRTVNIWTENDTSCFNTVLVLDPTYSMDHVRWVIPKNKNISEETFQRVTDMHANRADWISAVDQNGVLKLWRVSGVMSQSLHAEETSVQLKINGHDNQPGANLEIRLRDVCVMAYFSQNYVGMPSKLDLVLQREDHMLMSFQVAVGEVDRPVAILKKSWYRSHRGSISALSAHPSLPLVASVDTFTSDGTWTYEVLVYWISFSAFSARSRLIPSGVLPCEKNSGKVLCIQWVPTLHFDATPLLLVGYESGAIDVYGRCARDRVAVVSSPRVKVPQHQRKVTRSPTLSPWTFYNYETGESGFEYEVLYKNSNENELSLQFEENNGKLLVVRNWSSDRFLSEIIEGDELVGINNKSIVGKKGKDVLALIDQNSRNEVILMRFRAACAHEYQEKSLIEKTVSQSSTSARATSNPSNLGTFGSTVDNNERKSRNLDHVVHAVAVSMYGGWKNVLHTEAAPQLSRLCICPSYADDGGYVPDSVLIFGIESLPGQLYVWKGLRGSTTQSFELVPLQIQNPAIQKKANITSIASERDYRQRAFSSNRTQGNNSLNSLIFIGDAAGYIEHWRCQAVGNTIYFTMMGSHRVCGNDSFSLPNGHQVRESMGLFCRRGYVSTHPMNVCPESYDAAAAGVGGVSQIEVDDPNRLAVLHADRPEKLHVFEAESGLGILRLEETISSNGRGNILGFCWCSSHVEFNVDALAVKYEAAIVMYQYDTTTHRWSQIGDDIVTQLSLFDCTRDSSALLIGGGHLNDTRVDQSSSQLVSNNMLLVMSKWDEPGSLLQRSMDWKAAEPPQKLPVWHPYVLLTTMFGMHARVGEKDTSLAGDRASYEFSRAFQDATQMLKLLAKVIEDDRSAQASVASGVLSYVGQLPSHKATTKQNESGRAQMSESVGRYSTLIHQSDEIDKAENVFAYPIGYGRSQTSAEGGSPPSEVDHRTLSRSEAATILSAVDSILQGKAHPSRVNASVLFDSFSEEHLLEMKVLLSYVDAIQSLGFDLDASAADLGAKRFFSMHLFSKSLTSVVRSHIGDCASSSEGAEVDDGRLNHELTKENCLLQPRLEETPSSGLLWALHSDAQKFVWEHCIESHSVWDDMRHLWLGLWIKDVKDLREIVERFSRFSYMRSKNAFDVCLFYVALGKRRVLSALAKHTQSDSNKTLASFLDKNFLEKRWTDAAMKNAYSLLSKKKYQVAASFFLLCEPPRIQDAVRVLSVRLGDPSLALVISRLVEFQVDTKPQDAFTLSETGITPAGPVTKQLVENDVLPLFHQKHDVWLQSCAYWWLEDFNQAWAVLLPQFQDVDVCNHSTLTLDQNELVSSVVQATHFYINLTSLTLYFQHLHSNDNSPLVRWAKAKMHRQVYPDAPASPTLACSGNKRLQLASTIDIEHGFSFAAYVCKRNGLNDTALVEMLQARHLIDLHARFEIPTLEPSIDALNNPIAEDNSNSLFDSPTSPRFRSSLASWKRENKLSCCAFVRSPRQATWSPSQKQQSYSKEFFFPQKESQVTDKKTPLCQASELQFDRSIPTALWQQAQIADIECRRWASSAFVGKMIGILVARGMISHFRAELSMWFQPGTDNDAAAQNGPVRTTQEQQYHDRTKLHKAFLNELCNPLCQQFQLDRQYVFEAALAVMHPHAYLHIVEVCFLLSEIGRVSTLRKWLEYVSLSMLHSCSTFASCSIAEDVYRDWESLTIQLCYVVNLNSQGQISIPSRTIAHISVAVRTGIIFLSWARKRSDILREAVTSPFYTVSAASPDDPSATLSSYEFGKSLPLLRSLLKNGASNGQKTRKTQIWEGTLGYTFLGAVAANQADSDHISLLSWGDMKSSASENQLKTRKMYTLILMVSVLRTLHARATAFLSTYEEIRSGDGNPKETDIASSLFTPQKLWKTLSEGPLEGQRRWYTLIESHLRCEFDYSVKVSPCLCGLYGIDTMTFEAAANGTRKQMKCQNDVSRNGVLCSNSGHVNGGSVRGRNAIFPKETTEDMSLNNLQAFLGEIGLSLEQHMALVRASDDYILLLMQNARIGVQTRLRRFRLDPRVYVKSFVVQDAFRWFDLYQIFRCNTRAECYLQVHAFLRRCCKRRKLRLLVTHRGEDTQMFPSDHHYSQRTASRTCIARCASDASDGPPSRAFEVQAHDKDGFVLPEALYLQSMMFVDPWEVEAEYNVRRYMHYGQSPVHVELGWDRLSSICSETCDGIVVSVLQDPDLVTMWKVTGAKGWLVSAITQYRLDGLPSYRTLHQHLKHGLAEQEEPRLPLLVEIYSRSQRNAMFEEVGLPHRFVGVITVELIEARDLVSCSWVGKWSDAYVFLELSHSKDKCRETAQEWSLQTYRSSIGEGGVNPQWSTVDNRFVFRFAIPTHGEHTVSPTRTFHEGGNTVNYGDRREVSRLWNAEVNDQNRAALNALEHLFSSVFSGPPALLQCTVYQKNKILSHEFLGRAKIPLHELTSANPMDCWVPLEDTTSGSLHVKIFLSFQLMCSSMAMHC